MPAYCRESWGPVFGLRQIHLRKMFPVLLSAEMQTVGIPNLPLTGKLGGYGLELDCCVDCSSVL